MADLTCSLSIWGSALLAHLLLLPGLAAAQLPDRTPPEPPPPAGADLPMLVREHQVPFVFQTAPAARSAQALREAAARCGASG